MATSKTGRATVRSRLKLSDAVGISQLVTQATLGVTDIAQGVHRSVLSTMGLAGPVPGRTGGISGLVYGGVRGITRMVGRGVEASLATLAPVIDSPDSSGSSPERQAVLAALNGVLGDQLAASANPLATPMQLRFEGQELPEQPQGHRGKPLKILLLIHGLCMNDLQWSSLHGGQPHDHGAHLAQALGYTPIYLRYNTGLHTSTNGLELAQLLNQLQASWAAPLASISILVHSMGGLVIRSACHQGAQAGHAWVKRVDKLVFLGTPHHGAPLEKAGNWVDVLLGSNRFSKPFAKLAHIRSAGITDLRYGHVLDAHWQGKNRFQRSPDTRTLLPLPAGIACYTVAATLAAKRSPIQERLLGDGLVPLQSALGQHNDLARCLPFPPDKQFVAYRCNHMQLLNQPQVAQQLVSWLGT
jgi:hypothetical protein